MGTAAFATQIFIVGAPVAFNAEPTTPLGDLRYQITDETRRLIEPGEPIAAFDDVGNPLAISSIDFANGVIMLNDDPGTAVEIDGSFVTRSLLGGSKSYSYELTGDLLETTSFDQTSTNGGFRTRCYGLNDVTVSIDRYDDLGRLFTKSKLDRTIVFIEVRPGGSSGDALKGWFVVESDSLSGELSGLEEESINFMPANIGAGNEGTAVSFLTV